MAKNKAWWEIPKIQPQHLGNVIEDWLANTKLYNKKLFQLSALWRKISDEKMIRHTKVKNFRAQKLEILVDSPSYRFELDFKKELLLKKIRENCTDIYIKDICFTIGEIGCE